MRLPTLPPKGAIIRRTSTLDVLRRQLNPPCNPRFVRETRSANTRQAPSKDPTGARRDPTTTVASVSAGDGFKAAAPSVAWRIS
ncbi:hypothetical protein GCM10009858_45840 [Terrabacter carboxydivorans]|uniref:Uncharacterized protein n=1 Tax=Terrabacter carboxydivorans TaxID=619730 RepID=A0ABN3MIB9_9MICO